MNLGQRCLLCKREILDRALNEVWRLVDLSSVEINIDTNVGVGVDTDGLLSAANTTSIKLSSKVSLYIGKLGVDSCL